jgi:hypothetical protein
MMEERSSPSRTAGVCIREVTLGSMTYTLSREDRVRKAADEEAVVISRRHVPDELSGQDRADAIACVVCGIATPQEWSAYIYSAWLTAFRFWNALDPDDRQKALGRPVADDDRKADRMSVV